MAFPWILESNFELGTNAEWTSSSDTGSKMDFPHFSTLSRYAGLPAPFRGAYVCRVQMGDTNDHTLISTSMTIADTATAYTRFYFYLGKDVVATADDTMNIFELQGTANAVENAIGLRFTASSGLIEIGVGKTAPTVFGPGLTLGRWYCVELTSVIQTGGTGTGTLFIDGTQVAQVTTLTNTAVLRGVLGTQDTLSTTTGTVLYDQFIFDDARIYAISQRWSLSPLLTKSCHVFVGPGRINAARLMAGAATDCVLSIFDTDNGVVLDASKCVLELKNTANSQMVASVNDSPIIVQRGCYVQLSGTNPRAHLDIKPMGAFGGDGSIRTYGSKRTPQPIAA